MTDTDAPPGRKPRTDDASVPREGDSPPAVVTIPSDEDRDPAQDMPAPAGSDEGRPD